MKNPNMQPQTEAKRPNYVLRRIAAVGGAALLLSAVGAGVYAVSQHEETAAKPVSVETETPSAELNQNLEKGDFEAQLMSVTDGTLIITNEDGTLNVRSGPERKTFGDIKGSNSYGQLPEGLIDISANTVLHDSHLDKNKPYIGINLDELSAEDLSKFPESAQKAGGIVWVAENEAGIDHNEYGNTYPDGPALVPAGDKDGNPIFVSSKN